MKKREIVEIKFENEKLKPNKFYRMLREEIERQKIILCKTYKNVKFAYFKTKDYHSFNEFGEIENIESYIVLYFFRDETENEEIKNISEKFEEIKEYIRKI